METKINLSKLRIIGHNRILKYTNDQYTFQFLKVSLGQVYHRNLRIMKTPLM